MPKKLDFGYENITPDDESKNTWFGLIASFFRRIVSHNHDGDNSNILKDGLDSSMPVGSLMVFNTHSGKVDYNHNTHMECDGSTVDNDQSVLDGKYIEDLGNVNVNKNILDETTWVDSPGTIITLYKYGGCYGKYKYLTGGANGSILISSDSLNWISVDSGFGLDSVREICYGNGLYVAGGANGKLATSPDGITWTQRTSGFGSETIYVVCYGNGLYIAAGTDGKLATSQDGITWTQRTSSFSSYSISGVCYGNGLYIAIGSSGKLATSPDGITWTQRTSSFDSSYILDICYGNGLYIAVGSSGKLATSPDGITWTQRTSSFDSSQIYGVDYGRGIYAIAGLSGKIATSPDGITWTLQASDLHRGYRFLFYGNGMFMTHGALGIKPMVTCGEMFNTNYKWLVRYL